VLSRLLMSEICRRRVRHPKKNSSSSDVLELRMPRMVEALTIYDAAASAIMLSITNRSASGIVLSSSTSTHVAGPIMQSMLAYRMAIDRRMQPQDRGHHHLLDVRGAASACRSTLKIEEVVQVCGP
jgi:hypothetical protein